MFVWPELGNKVKIYNERAVLLSETQNMRHFTNRLGYLFKVNFSNSCGSKLEEREVCCHIKRIENIKNTQQMGLS